MAWLEVNVDLNELAVTMVRNMTYPEILGFLSHLDDEAMDSEFTIQARNLFNALSEGLED